MSETKIQLTLHQLKQLLDEQKRLTSESIKQSSSYWNGESTEGHSRSVNINEENYEKTWRQSKYPDHYRVLEKYL